MRLGILLPPLGGRAAGLVVYIREIVPRLLAQHPDWVLFTPERAELPRWCDAATVVRIGRGAAPRLAGRLVHRRLARLLAIQLDLRRELGRRDVAALLVPFHDGVYRCPTPQLIVVHDLTLLRHPRAQSRLAGLYLRLVFRPIARASAGLIAVSASTASDLRRFWQVPSERLRVVHEGFDREVFHPFGREEIEAACRRHAVRPPYLLYAGTLSRHKNLGVAIEALALLRDRHPDLSLLLAGPARTGDDSAVERHVRELGLEDRVRLLGYVDRGSLGPLMAGAAAFVFPSLQEGFGLAPLEAMASGAAVLASNRASLPEVVGAGGRLLDPERPAAWAEAIRELLARPEKDRELRQAALSQAALFDWDRSARRILDSLRALAGGL